MKKKDLSPDDYKTAGISCPSGHEAVDVSYEHGSISARCPNGKHRWKYKCKDPDTGKKSDTKYTEWICD